MDISVDVGIEVIVAAEVGAGVRVEGVVVVGLCPICGDDVEEI